MQKGIIHAEGVIHAAE